MSSNLEINLKRNEQLVFFFASLSCFCTKTIKPLTVWVQPGLSLHPSTHPSYCTVPAASCLAASSSVFPRFTIRPRAADKLSADTVTSSAMMTVRSPAQSALRSPLLRRQLVAFQPEARDMWENTSWSWTRDRRLATSRPEARNEQRLSPNIDINIGLTARFTNVDFSHFFFEQRGLSIQKVIIITTTTIMIKYNKEPDSNKFNTYQKLFFTLNLLIVFPPPCWVSQGAKQTHTWLMLPSESQHCGF